MTENVFRSRIASIDILRGFVIILMLIDHARERFYLHKQVLDPMDIDSTDPTLFFTRLSAHLCAPIFVFLTGLSAWLYANPSNGPQRPVQGFLIKRGLILILLEATLINFSWFAAYTTLYLQVIWAIGVSMISLALLAYLPRAWIAVLGLIIVFGHNLLTPVSFQVDELGYSLWTILHDRGYLIMDGIVKVKASYPVLPWIGVIMVGYAVGPLFSSSVNKQLRQKVLRNAGIFCLLLLMVLRGANTYGETINWQVQATFVQTVMDFLNYTKYPPSLNFLLFSLGIGSLILSWLEFAKSKWLEKVNVIGSVPMFFYIVHLYALLVYYAIGYGVFGPTMHYGEKQIGYLGVSNIGIVWLIAASLIVLLYWPCKKFGAFKRTTSMGWVKYF
ncbi:DUF1624 domain-containing protein [Pseudoalteromonas sp. C2R02]|uniref:DUF1624 domain-containing protein n=1 Tax=Pseudoalteromonas sp. C2R02 TaxID=2841565 RepID=UPI001C0984B2|nr:heparan-alpha-glucosaminide N-acetyltransferase domain-containing protein [Pseudoalteromonas sp. C2R02]MBU2972269.1 DUF1624 domain-containing protein [Pseudoalteromonas sp. C2R02]